MTIVWETILKFFFLYQNYCNHHRAQTHLHKAYDLLIRTVMLITKIRDNYEELIVSAIEWLKCGVSIKKPVKPKIQIYSKQYFGETRGGRRFYVPEEKCFISNVFHLLDIAIIQLQDGLSFEEIKIFTSAKYCFYGWVWNG